MLCCAVLWSEWLGKRSRLCPDRQQAAAATTWLAASM